MGTSSNQPSPNTPSWNIAQAALGHLGLDVERQSEELWQSALTDRDGRLTEELTNPLLASACEIAEETSRLRFPLRLAPSSHSPIP